MAWDYQKLMRLITDQVEENLNLDYKAADALQSTQGKRKEVTKDVSAMANSAGGVVIYGIAEYNDSARSHLPERIDPVDRTQFSKETLEHVIGNIQPRIEGLIIHSVSVPNELNHTIYVVDIPQSKTAHQAQDKRYYKRFNFEAVPMDDYEVRDVMFRQSHPRVELEFVLRLTKRSTGSPMPMQFQSRTQYDMPILTITAKNTGGMYAQYINTTVNIPAELLWDNWGAAHTDPSAFVGKTESVNLENTHRDVVGYTMTIPNYGPSRYKPLLPGMEFALGEINLIPEPEVVLDSDSLVTWSIFADNAPKQASQFRIRELKVIDERTEVQ